MEYVQQIAGGLDDAQFAVRMRGSRSVHATILTRRSICQRLFCTMIFLITVTWKLLRILLSGQRNSVQFINTPNIMDTMNTALGTFNPRQVDRDYYNGFTTEARFLHTLFSRENQIRTGEWTPVFQSVNASSAEGRWNHWK